MHKYVLTVESETRQERLDQLIYRAIQREFGTYFTLYRETETELVAVDRDETVKL